MTASPADGAGWGPRASLRPVRQLAGALALVLLVAACGGSAAPGSADDSPATGPTGPGPSAGAGGSGGGSPGAGNASAAIPNQVAGLALDVAPYRVPDAPDAAGGAELAAMLGALGLRPTDVTLLVGVERTGRLAIGRWELPGRDAAAILAAWKAAAGTGWQAVTLAGVPAVAGRGPDGSRAWAVARDGVFVYVVADDAQLAEQAVAATG